VVNPSRDAVVLGWETEAPSGLVWASPAADRSLGTVDSGEAVVPARGWLLGLVDARQQAAPV
jgi:hypothetical protein